jgi:hypothetical protein
MPQKRATQGSATRTIAPMIPLAIALLHTAVVSPPGGGAPEGPPVPTTVEAVKCGEGVEDYRACHTAYPTGCSSNGNYDPYLNLMKNQTTWASMQPDQVFTSLPEILQLEAKIPPGLGKSNHGDNLTQLAALGEGKIHGVVGYLYDIKVEGKESSNCQLEDDADHENVDFHIFIGFDGGVAEKIRNHTPLTPEEKKEVTQQSMIVEMTPHYRDTNHPEWTSDAVKAAKGQQVRVLGQLMVDNEHFVSGQDCAKDPRTAACWRASVWELHPVTDFQVCESGSCTATSTAGWTPVGEGSNAKAGSAPEPAPKRRSTAGNP